MNDKQVIPEAAVDNSRMTITEFLEARIAEDETQAAKHQESAIRHGWGDYTARVLAECAAKRAIIAYSPPRTLQHLAAIYDDHPGYRQEWDK